MKASSHESLEIRYPSYTHRNGRIALRDSERAPEGDDERDGCLFPALVVVVVLAAIWIWKH